VKAIDICAGAGGLSLGLQRAGFEVLGVEHDRAAHATHVANVGPCDLADVASWHPRDSVDLVAGGVPCQPFSSQGKRGGMAEGLGPLFPSELAPRAQLYKHLARIGSEACARAVLLENVRGLLAWNDGAALAAIKSELYDNGFGFTSHAVLDAADFGVPQHRERLFVVAFAYPEHHARFEWPTQSHGPGRAMPHQSVRLALWKWMSAGRYTKGIRRAAYWQGGRAIDVDAPSYTIGTRNNADWLVPEVDGPDPWAQATRLDLEQISILQGFPGDFAWPDGSSDAHRLCGNAVPPSLAMAVGCAVKRAIGDRAAEAA